MDELFAPFSVDQFPGQLDQVQLGSLLRAAPATTVPVSPTDFNVLDPLFPGLFKEDAARAAPRLRSRLHEALSAIWPKGTPSELTYSSFWDIVGYGLPEFAGQFLNEDIVQNRNVVDMSITLEDKKRDYFILVQNVLLVGGEDKSRTSSSDMEKAASELLAKHKGANASLYGDLGYILLIATAGQQCQLFGLRLMPNSELVCLLPRFEMVSLMGRQIVLRLFINIVRWMRTVVKMRLLPPSPPSPLLVPFHRPSPYGEEMGEVSLTLHWQHVEKKYSMPCSKLQGLLGVYAMLERIASHNAIHCREMKVNGSVVRLEQSSLRNLPWTGTCYVELDLSPCGAAPSITSDADLCDLACSLLVTLDLVHEKGFVHRDIRIENVVRFQRRWILIDWELAGKAGEFVDWDAKLLPEAVRCRREVYTSKADLWQIGKLILSVPAATQAVADFGRRLTDGEFESAASALKCIVGLR